MSDDITTLTRPDPEAAASALEHILGTGDLSKLTAAQRVAHYLSLCRSLGLSALSRPFDWLTLDGRLVLYPNKSCTEQLRRQHQISVKFTRREQVGELFVTEVEGRTPNGRTDQASKYVSMKDSRGNALVGTPRANAILKCETGAKRRLVLSMVGLASSVDPDEAGQSARYVVVDAHGNVIDHPTDEQKYLAENPHAARAINGPTFETTARAEDDPLAGQGVSQAARPDELEPLRREVERVSFRPTDDEVNHWLASWYAAVKGTSLDDDEGRHTFIEQWTDGRTRSLSRFFASATRRQADDLLGHVRAICEDEKRAIADAQQEMAEDDPNEEVAF